MTVTICRLKRVLQQTKMSLDTIRIFMWNRHISEMALYMVMPIVVRSNGKSYAGNQWYNYGRPME